MYQLEGFLHRSRKKVLKLVKLLQNVFFSHKRSKIVFLWVFVIKILVTFNFLIDKPCRYYIILACVYENKMHVWLYGCVWFAIFEAVIVILKNIKKIETVNLLKSFGMIIRLHLV